MSLNLRILYSSTPDLNKTIFKKSNFPAANIFTYNTPASLTMTYLKLHGTFDTSNCKYLSVRGNEEIKVEKS